jgi:hypothetical protein
MQLTDGQAVHLAILEAIEFESRTASWLQLELKATLSAAGAVRQEHIDRVLVQRAFAELERDGCAFGYWASNDLDEVGRRAPGPSSCGRSLTRALRSSNACAAGPASKGYSQDKPKRCNRTR